VQALLGSGKYVVPVPFVKQATAAQTA
jgi:hypothetical protein